MNWTTIRTALVKALTMNKMLLLAAMFAGVVLASAQASTFNTAPVQQTLCNVISAVQEVVGVIAILLFVLGGVMYAIAHMMPSAGQLRGNLQGWSMGMIVGGIVGLILVILAPGIVSFIIGNGLTQSANGNTITSSCTGLGLFGGF
jgi:cation transporter-like permease